MDAPLHRHARVVAFGDTDASGWMHFPNAFRYAEEAEHGFLRSRGLLVHDRALGGWPRVKAAAEFRKPLVAGESIEVHLRVARLGTSSVAWDFEILTATGETAVVGSMTTVRVDVAGKPCELAAEERAVLGG